MSKRRQAQNSTISNYPGFWGRLCDVLGTAKTGEIADILGVSASLVSDWKSERASPTLKILFDIAEIGGTGLDWLLTGNAPKVVGVGIDSTVSPLPADTRRLLDAISKQTGEEISVIVEQLVHEGLMFRGEPMVWHENEQIRRGEAKVVVSMFKWLRDLPTNEQVRFAKRMANLMLSYVVKISGTGQEDGEIGSLRRATSKDMMLARKLGKVDGGEEEEKIRKTG